jgi:hypothetical protein
MEFEPLTQGFRHIGAVLRGEPKPVDDCVRRWSVGTTVLYVALTVLGTAVYGAAMGWWRSPLQACFTAIKFPLIILLTTLGNGLLNGMLAPLLGINLSFRQSLQAILMSFMISGAILGSVSPVIFYLVWNAPQMTAHATGVYAFIQLTQVVVVAFAGVVANLRLEQLLQRVSGSATISRRVLYAWLAGNLFLGSQLSWILRPFIGSPEMRVEFLRKTAFDGNFYETVFRALRHLFSP